MSIRDAVIVSTARTPIGKAYKGAFNATPSPTLAAFAIKAAVERAGIDPAAAAQTPFGGTIAHGFLSLSLLSRMAADAMQVPDTTKMAVNYGLDRVRFIAPVRAGSRVRGRFVLDAVEDKAPGQLLLRHTVTVEIENHDKPALTAQWLGLIFTSPPKGA